MAKALITGHEGFIGSHFARYLRDRDWEVFGCDIKSGQDCRDRFKHDDTQYDLVIHCAAIVGGRLTIDNEPLMVATDLAIDAEMFNWALRTKQKRVVYFSSSAAYPVVFQAPNVIFDLKEDHIQFDDLGRPDMTYGWAKLTGEFLASFANNEGLPVHVFRPFSGYGTDQALDYPFPSLIERVKNQEDPFEIWGGSQSRDFIHVDDIVGLVMTAVNRDVRGPINLCTGRATDFVTLAQTMFRVAGWNPSALHLRSDMPTGVHRRVGDPYLMNKLLGKPHVSLEEGIERALNGQN